MITVDQILAAEDKVLRQLLSEVLGSETCKHCISYIASSKKCVGPNSNDITEESATCDDFLMDYIPLDDWNVSMKWRDWAVKEYGKLDIGDFMWEIFKHVKGYEQDVYAPSEYSHWLTSETTPKHYLQAAAICKLNSEKGKK